MACVASWCDLPTRWQFCDWGLLWASLCYKMYAGDPATNIKYIVENQIIIWLLLPSNNTNNKQMWGLIHRAAEMKDLHWNRLPHGLGGLNHLNIENCRNIFLLDYLSVISPFSSPNFSSPYADKLWIYYFNVNSIN